MNILDKIYIYLHFYKLNYEVEATDETSLWKHFFIDSVTFL